MSQQNKSVLFKTSAGSDVQYVGGEIKIPGLNPIKQSRIVDFSQMNYRAEVSQVVTVGGVSAYTPTASTRYIVCIGDVNRRDKGMTELPFQYSYTTSADLSKEGANDAVRREYISLQLVAKINAVTNNWVVAATLGSGNGFTITDDAGYYPAPSQGMTNREGASTVFLKTDDDGRGFAITNLATITAAVYANGVGATLAAYAPVFDLVYSNLISGFVDGPKTISGESAVSGQKYNLFSISYLDDSESIPSVGHGITGILARTASVWVDNGAGTDTTNATGYAAFERNLQRGILARYTDDQASIVEFFDGAPIAGAKAGGAPVGTTGSENTLHLSSGNVLHYAILGVGQTLTAPAYVATGLQLDLDAADNEGAEYSAPVDAVSGKEFVVGKTEFSLIWKASIANVSDTDDCLIGFRKKEAYQANVDDYDELAALNVNAGNIFISTILNGAATTDTDTTLNWADTETHELEVRVLTNGAVKFYVDSVDVTEVQVTNFSFDAGETVIPFMFVLNAAASAPTVVTSKFAAVPAIWKY